MLHLCFPEPVAPFYGARYLFSFYNHVTFMLLNYYR